MIQVQPIAMEGTIPLLSIEDFAKPPKNIPKAYK